MRKARRRALASLAAIPVLSLVTAAFAASASATTGTEYYSPVQAGYVTNGTTFHGIKSDFNLPDPTTFASEGLARVQFTEELWSSTRVMELGAWAKTTGSAYHVTASVWNRTTKTLICSTSSTTRTCHGTPPGWAARTFPSGSVVWLSLYFHQSAGQIRFNIIVPNKASYDFYYNSGTQPYSQARVGADFGCSPWTPCGGASQVSYTPPGMVTKLITSGDTEVYPDHSARSGLFGAFVLHKLVMTSNGTSTAKPEVAPSYPIKGQADYPGGQFNVNLQP